MNPKRLSKLENERRNKYLILYYICIVILFSYHKYMYNNN